MTRNVSYHITYVEIFTMDRKLNILSQASQIFHESSFSCSVVMCGLSLQLSEYSAYDFANNASKVSITFLPPCLPPCHPPPPFSSSHSSSFLASFSTATVDHTTATVAVKCMNFKFWPVTFSAGIFDQSRCLVCFTMKFQGSYLPRNVSYYQWINECWV